MLPPPDGSTRAECYLSWDPLLGECIDDSRLCTSLPERPYHTGLHESAGILRSFKMHAFQAKGTQLLVILLLRRCFIQKGYASLMAHHMPGLERI